MDATWRAVRRAVDVPFWLAGIGLSLYIGANVFGWIRNSSEHYSVFVLAVVFLSGMIAIRNVVDARLAGRAGKYFWPRLVVAAGATVIAVAGAGFIRVNAIRLESIQPFFGTFDIVMGLVFTVGVLLLTWIHWGPLLTGIVTLAILYFFFGHHIDSVLFTHPQYSAGFVLNYLGLGVSQGFFWLAQLAADSIYFLILYAAILLGIGMLRMVIEVGKLSGRHLSGGAAFPALIGSGIVASVMGQAVSNVVLTGRFTIPMMKGNGFHAAMAGAIESVASTSGQIMPPILGLGAFIMAAFLSRPYIDIALSAMIPALLFLSGVTIGVLIYSRRHKLPKLNERVDMVLILRMLPAFVVSFSVVLVMLLRYYSPSFAGLVGIAIALTLCLFQGKYRPTWKSLVRSVEEGFVLVTLLSLLLIAIGPLGQVMITTNLSGRLGTVLLAILPNSTIILLIGAMVVSLILGMGLPTPVAYVVVALAVVPFMQQLGIPPLQAHFFVFYFAVFSTLTPPVAISVLAAAKLANASFLETAADAMKLAVTTFIIPFAFVYNPVLTSFPNLSWAVVPAVLEVVLIQWTISVAAYGYLRRALAGWERWGFVVISLLGFAAMISHRLVVDALFLGLLALAAAWIWLVVPAKVSPAVIDER